MANSALQYILIFRIIEFVMYFQLSSEPILRKHIRY